VQSYVSCRPCNRAAREVLPRRPQNSANARLTDDFDPLAKETFTSAHEAYAGLRRECPVAHSTAFNGFWGAALLRGVDAEQRAVGFVGEQVEQAVGALADIADAVVEVAEDTFAVEFFPLVVEIDAL
jgi:hypothetical protein